MTTSNAPGDLPMRPFERPQAWADWLEQHHTTSAGIWLQLAKKAAWIDKSGPQLPNLSIRREQRVETHYEP